MRILGVILVTCIGVLLLVFYLGFPPNHTHLTAANHVQSLPLQLSSRTSLPEFNKIRVFVIVINGLQLEDLTELDSIIQKSSIGLMNTVTAGKLDSVDGSVTLGAGSRAKGSKLRMEIVSWYERTEEGPAREVYLRRTGKHLPAGTVLNLDVRNLIEANAELKYKVQPGFLGSTLQSHGVATYVFGNTDTPTSKKRDAVLIAMNEEGYVTGGDVGSKLTRPSLFAAFGLETNWDTLKEAVSKISAPALIVIDTGDYTRSLEYSKFSMLEQANLIKGRALANINSFLKWTLEIMTEKDVLMVISPSPGPLQQDQGNSLTPLLISGPGFHRGLLTSASTKRPGIVLNQDFAPTVIKQYGLNPGSNATGAAIYSLDHPNPLNQIKKFYIDAWAVQQRRPFIIKTYVVAQIIALIAATTALLFRLQHARILRVLGWTFVFLASVPIAMLCIPPLPLVSTFTIILFIVGLAAIITSLAVPMTSLHESGPFLLIGAVTVIIVSLEVFWGSPHMLITVLGYSPIGGARFYGIGNEYMGVLLGSSLITVGGLLDISDSRWKSKFACRHVAKVLLLSVLGVIAYVIGAPNAGANWGGFVSAAIAFSYFGISAISSSSKSRFLTPLIALALTIAVTLADATRPIEAQTHVGRLVSQVLYYDNSIIWDTIVRKAQMNLKLIRYTIWSRALLASIATITILIYRPPGLLARAFARQHCLALGLKAAAVGALIALIFNDSGVVAAGTSMIFVAGPVIYNLTRDLQAEPSQARELRF